MTFVTTLTQAHQEQRCDAKLYRLMLTLYTSYAHSLTHAGMNMEEYEGIFADFLHHVLEGYAHPYPFTSYHQMIRTPYDYYQFGLDFVRPLFDKEKSRLYHPENIEKILNQLAAGENVILLANHQTEVDPQLISLVLEERCPQFAAEIIFVAGDRVLTDPMAIPFSMGRNLFCIYSKRHIDTPPEKKAEKHHHNQRTIRKMQEVLSQGGKCVYVAPSGGRDRPDASGEVPVAPFDPESIEIFRLVGKQTKRPTHFYPLSLSTFSIFPPPQTIQVELGEERQTARDRALFWFGEEVDIDQCPGVEVEDRQAKRAARAQFVWSIVSEHYERMKKGE